MNSPAAGQTFIPIPFLVSLDDFSPDPILSSDPLKLIQDGIFNDVPLMIGSNKDEGHLFVGKYLSSDLFTMNPEIWRRRGPALLLGR